MLWITAAGLSICTNWISEKHDVVIELNDCVNKLQVNDCVNKLTDEKTRLDCELTESKVEVEALGHTRSTLEMQNAQLRERVVQLEQQASHYTSWDSTLSDLVDSKKRIAYERGKLQSRVEQLQEEMESLTDVQNQHNQLKRSFAALEAKYSKVTFLFNLCLSSIERNSSRRLLMEQLM